MSAMKRVDLDEPFWLNVRMLVVSTVGVALGWCLAILAIERGLAPKRISISVLGLAVYAAVSLPFSPHSVCESRGALLGQGLVRAFVCGLVAMAISLALQSGGVIGLLGEWAFPWVLFAASVVPAVMSWGLVLGSWRLIASRSG